jgi:hypothetical protein
VAPGLVQRPLRLAAVLLVALEALVGALGGRSPVLSLATLALAPGLALSPLLPARVRESPLGVLAAAPTLSFAAVSVPLISIASAGIPLTATSVRLMLAALVVLGALLPGSDPGWSRSRGDGLILAGLGLALVAGVLLERRVIGGTPVPGNDWAKYVLYGDEIRAHGKLLLDNPFWMLGVPFREDPGVPSVYGAFLALAGEPASVLTHGIWAFAVALVLSTFAFVRGFWGDLAGVIAAGLLAVLPISHDILAWHGAANLAALALLPLLLAYAILLLSEGLSLREAAGFALVLVALAAAHRLSLLTGGLTLAAIAAVALTTGDRARTLRALALTAGALAVLAPGVVYDLVERGRSFGGTLGSRAYLSAKVELGPVAGDLTVVFTVVAIAALVLAVRWSRADRRLVPLLCLLGVTVALAYAWIFSIPVAYFRMAYFLPVALTPLVAVALARLLDARRAAAAGGVLAAVIAAFAWAQAANVRDFYSFSSDSSLRGLDAVAATLRPGEVVVTDRCWSFQTAWLLHTRTLSALEPEDIQPKAELRRAREARAVLDGTPSGMALARRLRVRFLIVDPTCTDAQERPARPPLVGSPLYVSKRLVVLRLPSA